MEKEMRRIGNEEAIKELEEIIKELQEGKVFVLDMKVLYETIFHGARSDIRGRLKEFSIHVGTRW